MAILIITGFIILLTTTCAFFMWFKLRTIGKETITMGTRLQLIATGIIAFIADTIGIGSFAANTALAKALKLFKDEEIPGFTNGAQVIPGALSAIFFMQVIKVEYAMLITLVLGTCIGGILGGYFVTRLSQQKVRLAMILAFLGVVVLLTLKQLGYIPQSGELTSFSKAELIIGFFAMIFCGSLTSFGIGLFVMVQAVLFLMHASPVIAFPIMTTAGAMQQPLTTFIFLKRDRIPLQKTLIISLSGCIGIFLGIPIVSHLNALWLHNLLLIIMIYNTISIGMTYLRQRHASAVLSPT